MEQAYKNAEFNVMVDPFMTPTAQACCDVFLPVCMYPERNGIRSIYYHVQTTNQACKPLGESKVGHGDLLELGLPVERHAVAGRDVGRILHLHR